MITSQTDTQSAEWLEQYEFWHKIISEEVERLRFNDGLEPIDVDLYAAQSKKHRSDPDYLGLTRIGRRKFHAVAFHYFDAEGKKILRVQIRPD